MASVSEAKEYLKTYVQEYLPDMMRKLKSIPDKLIPLTAAWNARLLTRGAYLTGSSIDFIEAAIEKAAAMRSSDQSEEVAEAKKATFAPSIQERTLEKGRDFGGELEGLLDDIIYHQTEDQNLSFYDWFRKTEIAPVHVTRKLPQMQARLDEMIESQKRGADEQLREGYAQVKTIKQVIVIYKRLVDDMARYAMAQKTQRQIERKPRAKKEVPATKKVSKLQFLKESSEFKIVSIDPERIIGAQELWVTNTKYKTLTVLRAMNRSGLDVKGTTIVNIDPDFSLTKRIGRKTDETLQGVMAITKSKAKKFMDGLSGSQIDLKDRVTGDTLLLKTLVERSA